MQRMIPTATPLPPCPAGHPARHMHDLRRASAGGGHFIECACRQTAKHPELADALAEWCRSGGHPLPITDAQRQLPLRNVINLRKSR